MSASYKQTFIPPCKPYFKLYDQENDKKDIFHPF